MKVNFQDIGQLDDADPKSITRAIIVPAKEGLRQVRQAMTGNLTLRDNMYAAVVTFGTSITPMTSGTEWTFANPLKTTPIGFTLLTATNTAGVVVQLASPPKLNTSRTDGLLGLTALQNATGPMLDIVPSAAQTISSTANVQITFDGTSTTDGSGIFSIASNGSGPASTRCVVSEPGLYLFTGQVVFAPNATGDREVFICKNSAGAASATTVVHYNGRGAAPLDITGCNFSQIVPMVANDYVEVFVFQSSGGNLSTRATASGYASRLTASRIGQNPLSKPSIIVTGILWGG